MKTYAEKLKDPRWQRKRLEIMQRDEFACTHCGDVGSTLNVHHLYYKKGRDPWEYDDEVLITVCESCHSMIERQKQMLLSIAEHGGHWSSLCNIAQFIDNPVIHSLAAFMEAGAAGNDARIKAHGVEWASEIMECASTILKIASQSPVMPCGPRRNSVFDDLIDAAPCLPIPEPPPWKTKQPKRKKECMGCKYPPNGDGYSSPSHTCGKDSK